MQPASPSVQAAACAGEEEGSASSSASSPSGAAAAAQAKQQHDAGAGPAPPGSTSPGAASTTASRPATPCGSGEVEQRPPASPAAGPSQPGVLFWTDGRCRTMPVALRVVAMLTLLFFIAWIYCMSALMLLAPFSRLACTLVVMAWLTLLLPCQPVMWRGFMANPIIALWRRYFSFAVTYEEKLDPNRHYLFADFPHGAFPVSQLLALSVRHLACWEGERFYGMAADSVFRIPLWRHVYTWLGIVPASAANLRQHLKWGSVGITPGGIAEMYLAGGGADHIYVRNRKGFVAVAVEEGVDIVPVYHLGNSACLSFGPKFLEPLGRRWRFSLGLLYGVAGLPIPRRVRLLMTVGAPVAVTKTPRSDPAFQQVVDDTHARFMDALQALYDKHRGLYGWADHPLVMH